MTFTDKWLSKNNVLDMINERSVYESYFGQKIDCRVNRYRNPFRADKNAGSCRFSESGNRLNFHDEATGEIIDLFSFVMRKYGLTFYEALYKIKVDCRLKLMYSESYIRMPHLLGLDKVRIEENPEIIEARTRPAAFRIVKRNWNKRDGSFWYSRYRIKGKTLVKHNVFPVESYDTNYIGDIWKESYTYISHNPVYAYITHVKNREHIKLYRPYDRTGRNKWKSDGHRYILHGYHCLPKKGDLLFVTSSLKDGMCIEELGYNFVSCASETSYMSHKHWNDLKNRFKRIVYLLDNDDTGRYWSVRMSAELGCEFAIIPDYDKCKDLAEIVENYGQEELKKVMNNLDYQLI